MKFPYLTESRYFFFGLIEVRQWGWRAGLTKPQIDLLLIDQPVIDYKHEKSTKHDKNAWKTRKAKSWKVNAAADKWRQENQDGGKTTFSLSGFSLDGEVKEQ